MHILIVDDKVPDPHFGAGFPRAYRLLLSLISLKHHVHFFPTVKNSISDLNLDLLSGYGINVYENIRHVPNADVVIMSRPHNVHYYLPIVREHLPNAKVIYDTEALWFRRYDLQLSITNRLPGWAYRYDELGLARAVDLCFVVNDVEKKILEEAGAKKVVKLGHSLKACKEGVSFSDRKDFLVVGGKLEEDSSNEDALWWYLQNAWGQVHTSTTADLNITGLATSPRLKSHAFAGANLLGHVNDLVPLYQQHRVFVATTRFATGIPWKVHEAMAHGIPCLISKLLADQLALKVDSDALVADCPEEAIIKSIRLYYDADLWEYVRENAFNLIAKDCDPSKFKRILAANLFELVR